MLKLNLTKGPKVFNLRPVKSFAAVLLSLALIWQMASSWQRKVEAEERRGLIQSLKARIEELQKRRESLKTTESPEALNGEIQARNEWQQRREKSPALLLARLEKERPGAIELKSFESTDIGGTIRMDAGDMDNATRYMNTVFGHKTGRLTMEERSKRGIIAVYQWNE